MRKPPKNIVIGQKVTAEKIQRAKELRQSLTDAEKLLWERLRTNQLGGLHFRRQQVIAGFIVDFYCHSAGLVVELDGGVHETQADYDQERDRVLQDHGLRVLRIQNREVFENLDAILIEIHSACTGRPGLPQ
jgi:very-short-patch-repair endonuclease